MAISFREKKPLLDSMRGVQYFEPDMALLKKHLPNHELCKRKYLKPEKHQAEALWALLDVLSQDDIVKNRRGWFKSQVKKKVNAIAKESGKLTAEMERAETLVALETIFTRIKEVVEPVPEDVRATMMKLADSVYAKQKVALTVDPEKEKAEKLELINNTLLKLDLKEATQKDMAKIVRDLGDNLGATPINMKGDTLRPLLLQYVANLPKTDTGNGKVKPETRNPELESENEELKEELENKEEEVSDLEDEKDDLQEENEELQQQNENLEEQLEEQKKSEEPAAANVKNGKSTPTSSGESSK